MAKKKLISVFIEDDKLIISGIQFLIKKLHPELQHIKMSRAILIKEMANYIIGESEKHGIKITTNTIRA